LYALDGPFFVPLNTRLRGSIVREILDACLKSRDAKPLHFQGNFVGKADRELVPTDSFQYLSPTKRMIVEENSGKWKIFFRGRGGGGKSAKFYSKSAGNDSTARGFCADGQNPQGGASSIEERML
jgi:hypothetical protein